MTQQPPSFSEYQIKVSGSILSQSLASKLVGLEVDLNLFLPAMCLLEFSGVDTSNETSLRIGAPLELQLKPQADFTDATTSSYEAIFKGEIVSLEASLNSDSSSKFMLRAFDKAHRMQHGTKARTWNQVTDSSLAQTISGDYGLSADVDSTNYTHPQIIQDNVTDWDFLHERAHLSGRLFYVDDGKLKFKKPATMFASSAIPLEWGSTLLDFFPRVTVGYQAKDVKVGGWDIETKAPIVGMGNPSDEVSTASRVSITGSRADSLYASKFAAPPSLLITDKVARTQALADQIATSLVGEVVSSDFTGDGRALGSTKLRPGTVIEIRNIEKFSGKYFITSATHVLQPSGYYTDIKVSGLNSATFTELITRDSERGRSTTSGRISHGVVPAIVTNNADDRNMGRVKVKFPWFDDKIESFWARVATPMAGPSRGFLFMPEVNDEVLVSFEHGDFNYPVVIGAFWNGKDAPPESAQGVSSGKVEKRVIKTRAGHILRFDDTSGSEKIEIIDKSNNNLITIDTTANKITIQAQKDIAIIAKTGNVDITASAGNISLKGLQVSAEAQTKATVKGPQVEVSGDAMTTIKGGIVQIN